MINQGPFTLTASTSSTYQDPTKNSIPAAWVQIQNQTSFNLTVVTGAVTTEVGPNVATTVPSYAQPVTVTTSSSGANGNGLYLVWLTAQDTNPQADGPIVSTLDVNVGSVIVSSGSIDIANTPDVNIFSVQTALIATITMTAGSGSAPIQVNNFAPWANSISCYVPSSGNPNFLSIISAVGNVTGAQYINGSLVPIDGLAGQVPVLSCTVLPTVDPFITFTWGSCTNTIKVYVVASSLPVSSPDETAQDYTVFSASQSGAGSTILLASPAQGRLWEIAYMTVGAATTAAGTLAAYIADDPSNTPLLVARETTGGTDAHSDAHFYFADGLFLVNQTSVMANAAVLARPVGQPIAFL
jgi:hypothetical protein